MVIIERKDIDTLLPVLSRRGFITVGPTVRNDTIVYDEIGSTSDFPVGRIDEQDCAKYRLIESRDESLFGFASSPHSWKRFLFPPRLKFLTVTKKGKALAVNSELDEKIPKYAFIGVRSCDLHAIALQDKVFIGGEFIDPVYQLLRKNLFIVAVQCTRSGGTCFCSSMETGPEVTLPFDLLLTEVSTDGIHHFVAKEGSDVGREVLREVPHRAAEENEIERAQQLVARTAEQMKRSVDTAGLREVLLKNLEHPQWEGIAERCLLCANCTMVCPTCFCSTVEDTTDLTGDRAERTRRWDSCFSADFAKVTGGNFRLLPKSRYRQWLTHKFSSWIDQFGSFGCVGCGRCITWCPAEIDITQEIHALQSNSIR